MRKILLATAALLSLAACTTVEGGPSGLPQPTERTDINPGYAAGRVLGAPTVKETPTLEELVNVRKGEKVPTDPEDRLRMPAMRDAAQIYGARGGHSFTARRILDTLNARATEFARIYDFQRLMIKGPDGVMVLPPVISESRDTWEAQDAGKTLRVADQTYIIEEQARFAPVAPLWLSYIHPAPEPPTTPFDAVLPKNDGERDLWARWVREGWEQGVKLAHEIFEKDLDRLNRDYEGMVRYKALLAEGKVSPPVVAQGRMGTTGSGNDMRVNDRNMRITRDPQLVVNQNQWQPGPAVSGMVPEQAATPPGGVPAQPWSPSPGERRQ